MWSNWLVNFHVHTHELVLHPVLGRQISYGSGQQVMQRLKISKVLWVRDSGGLSATGDTEEEEAERMQESKDGEMYLKKASPGHGMADALMNSL